MNRTLMIIFFASMLSAAALGAATVAPSAIAHAADEAALRTQTFVVQKMTCAACPITVRTAMSRVEGVRSVEVDFNARTATVTFDPAITTTDEIARASADAGYPAQIADS
ncbi:MAG: heavy metal transporter [Alphaproteobacteria bacterium HGW-Alphaproteobacteria-5]|nr:MAG: heavy metal transporter [Alphaproteobacteria bacterium HGW-Alphaproteobacteria-5]